MNISVWAKLLILATGSFPAWSLNIFFPFLNQNILFPECPKKDQTHILDILMLFEYMLRIKIKTKQMCKNEDNLNLFWKYLILYGMKWLFIYCLVKQFFISYSPEGISLSSRSMNMGALGKDSDDINFSFVGLAELSLLKCSQH